MGSNPVRGACLVNRGEAANGSRLSITNTGKFAISANVHFARDDRNALIASPIAFEIFRELRLAVSVEGIEGLGKLGSSATYDRIGFGLFSHVKSALLTAIFGITGGVAILLAVPAEEKAPVIKIHPPKWFPDYGDPVYALLEKRLHLKR